MFLAGILFYDLQRDRHWFEKWKTWQIAMHMSVRHIIYMPAYDAWWVFLPKSLVLRLRIIRLKEFSSLVENWEALLSFCSPECHSPLVVNIPCISPAVYRKKIVLQGMVTVVKPKYNIDGYICNLSICDIRVQFSMAGFKKNWLLDFYFPQLRVERRNQILSTDFLRSHLPALLT